MAVAFDAVGPSSSGTASVTSPLTWTHVCGAGATVLLVGVTCDAATDTGMVLSATYNGVAMTSLGLRHSNDQTAGYIQLFRLDSPATGSNTVSVTEAGGSGLGGLDGGSISFTGSASVSAAQTAAGAGTTASLAFTPTSTGNMVAAFAGCGSALTPSGSFTSRFNENAGSGQAAAGYAAGSTIASTGGSVTASWTSASDWWAVIAVEVQAPAASAPAVPPAMPGRTWLRRFRHRQVLPAPPAPPPMGVASLSAAGTVSALATVIAPATLTGAGSVSASTASYIAGLGGSGAGYFTDNGGSPRMVLGDAVWALCGNAGRWNSGNWQADYDTFLANRASQGFTVIYTKPMGTTQNGGINDDGRTFDSLFPFQGGTPSTGVSGANPSSGLTSAYWARIDYFLASALAKGITVFLNAIGYSSDFDSGPGPLAGKSSTEFGAYGTALGTRYASQGNLIWMVADDYFGSVDAKISAFLTSLRAAGASQPISIENYPETTSRKDVSNNTTLSWGTSNGQFNFVYSYNVTYFAVEKAYLESSPVPVIWGDGYFYQGGNSGTYQGGTGAFAYDHAVRQDAWHAVSSGARGWVNGSEGIWQYQSSALADSALEWWYVHNAGAIRLFIEGLKDWQLLVPDTSSALVTAGRGTHASTLTSGGGGGQYEVAFSDSYVTASRTPSGSLAVIYMSHGSTITIDQSQMASGYTATWVDPVTLATSSATPGTTYNSTAKGSNSAGEADWALVLQAPPVVSGTATLAGSGSVSALAAQGSSASPSGAGSVSAKAAQGASLAATAAGSLSSLVTQAAPAALAGTGSLTAASGGSASGVAALSGAGSLAALATAQAPAALSGAGSVAGLSSQAAPAAVTAVGSLSALVTERAIAALAGAGVVSASSGGGQTAALAGAGALSAVAIVSAPCSLPGAGALAVSAVQGAVSAPAAAGSLAALAAQRATATVAGAGAVTAMGAQVAPTAFGRSAATGRVRTTAVPGTGSTASATPGGAP